MSDRIYIYSFSKNLEISFENFLTDYSDTYTANWSPQDVYGRMDPIYTYKNTVRKITLGFDVPSFSLDDAKFNSESADNLIQSMYPIYKEEIGAVGAATLQSPPLFKISMANLITTQNFTTRDKEYEKIALNFGLLGYIDNFSFKPDIASGFFSDTFGKYPKLYKVNFTFFPIHEHPLGVSINQENMHVNRIDSNFFPHQYINNLNVLNESQKTKELKNKTQDAIKLLQARQAGLGT